MPVGQRSNDEYMADFWACLPKESAAALFDRARALPVVKTRAFYRSRQEHRVLRLEDIFSLGGAQKNGLLALEGAAVVVENIDPHWIAVLGTSWDISPSFFAQHASNPSGPSPWQAVIGLSASQRRKPQTEEATLVDLRYSLWDNAHFWHVDGVFACGQRAFKTPVGIKEQNFMPRLLLHSKEYGTQTSTRISFLKCINKSWSMCLVLVDAPFGANSDVSLAGSNLKVELCLPISNNRGGLVFPQLFDKPEYSLYECLQQFLSHTWHFNALFSDVGSTVTPEILFYLALSSTWETNFRLLESEIKRIGFDEIRKPTTSINDKLHDRRQDLDSLRGQVLMARKWMPHAVKDSLNAIQVGARPEHKYIGFPDHTLTDIMIRSESLERFLMDSFKLLISSTSVMEAEVAFQQGVHTQRLTILAFLYVPLSFVTGVFGMNIKEINDSPLSVWVPIAALGVTLVVTAAFFTVYIEWEKRRPRKT